MQFTMVSNGFPFSYDCSPAVSRLPYARQWLLPYARQWWLPFARQRWRLPYARQQWCFPYARQWQWWYPNA